MPSERGLVALRDQLLGGRYRLVRQLGEGGMGQVWEAHDGTLERSVAVKVITLLSGGGSRGDEARMRFLREARITGLLQHPNIVTVHDLGETDGEDGKAPFLVMELVRGEGLDAVLRRGPVPLTQAADWGAQICDALAEAHQAGVLHRDIKPSNIQVLPSGATKVLDFGIARAADPYATADRLTQTGFIVGTPPYMAPEQARGNAEARSDLYALGCLLFEMITGSLPFRAPDTLGYITAHLTQEPPAPSTLATGIPPAWDDVVLALLRKDPRERYESAVAVARALRQLGRDSWHPPTVVDTPDTAAELAAARRSRHRQIAAALRRLEHRRTLEHNRAESGRRQQVREREPVAEGGFTRMRNLVTGLVREQTGPEPGWTVAPNNSMTQPAEFPRRLGPHAYGLLVKLLIAATVLAVWATIYHQINPQESMTPTGSDWAVIVIAFLICVAAESARLVQARQPRGRIRVDAEGVTVEREVEQQGRTSLTRFAIPWAAVSRIGVEGLGLDAPVVVWFSFGNTPSKQWMRQHGVSRHTGGGYVLCHPGRVAYSLLSANSIVRALRKDLSAYGGTKHVKLVAPRR